MKLTKKVLALAIVVALTISGITGCKREVAVVDNSEVVMVVNGTDVTMGVANFFVRWQQSMVESMYVSYMGENAWTLEMEDGVTYEQDMKDRLLEELQRMYIVTQHAEEYKVALSDQDVKDIEAAADSFVKENKDDAKKAVSGDKDIIVAYLKLLTLDKKMSDAIKAKADTNVTDKEAAQKKMAYAEFDKKEDAEAFLKNAKQNGNLEAYGKDKGTATKTLTFDAKNTSLDEAVIKAADALKLNGFSEVVKGKDKYYVMQLTSEFDADATKTRKEALVEEKKVEFYDKTVEDWKNNAEITVHKEVWNKISLDGLKISVIQDEKKEETTEKTEEKK